MCPGRRQQHNFNIQTSREFKQRLTSTVSEPFSLLMCLDATKFVSHCEVFLLFKDDFHKYLFKITAQESGKDFTSG